MSERTDYLEMIQATIRRMADHSFSIKGWSITVVSALIAIGINQDNPWLASLAVLPALIFWGLDAYYLWQERLYRRLWNDATDVPADTTPSFSMETAPYRSEDPYRRAIGAPVVWAVHGTAVVAAIVIAGSIGF